MGTIIEEKEFETDRDAILYLREKYRILHHPRKYYWGWYVPPQFFPDGNCEVRIILEENQRWKLKIQRL
ncbi:MAG: hypothetical protein QW356_08565 [Candidatus Hadarchaeales archaeon]